MHLYDHDAFGADDAGIPPGIWENPLPPQNAQPIDPGNVAAGAVVGGIGIIGIALTVVWIVILVALGTWSYHYLADPKKEAHR